MPDLSELAGNSPGDQMTLISLQEERRRAFEKWHALYFPGINVTRKGDDYTKQIVNNRWFVWQGARGVQLPIPDAC